MSLPTSKCHLIESASRKLLTHWLRIQGLSDSRFWAKKTPGLYANSILLFSSAPLQPTHTDNYDSGKQSRNGPVLTQHQQHKKRKSIVEKLPFHKNIPLTKEQSQPFII